MKQTKITAVFEIPGSAGMKALIPCIMARDVLFQRTQDYGLV
ncbi:hypothetical protein [Candidatus Magnetobacterium casense]|nr:hypothetical protein [Candidatus Magnetobacterium casensis]